MSPVRRIDTLIAQADVLAAEALSARDALIRVESDPLATPAAVREAQRRCVRATARANGFSAVVGAAVKRWKGD